MSNGSTSHTSFAGDICTGTAIDIDMDIGMLPKPMGELLILFWLAYLVLMKKFQLVYSMVLAEKSNWDPYTRLLGFTLPLLWGLYWRPLVWANPRRTDSHIQSLQGICSHDGSGN